MNKFLNVCCLCVPMYVSVCVPLASIRAEEDVRVLYCFPSYTFEMGVSS